MTPDAPLPVIVNRSGGTASAKGGALSDAIEQAFADVHQPIALELVEGRDVAAAVERHKGAPRIAVGGGDGTLGSAAGVLAASASELAVLPLGTRNHFARQLGIPLDLAQAAELAARGRGSAVDLGDAAGRPFINNASLGAYVELVREREKSALPKLPASVVAGWRVLRKLRPQSFDLEIDGRPQGLRSAMLFIGNNLYEVLEGRPNERAALDDGVLSLFALAPLTRGGVVRAAMHVMLGRPDRARDFALLTTAHEIRLKGHGETDIALDGERMRLPLPLVLEVRPRALKVVAPEV